VIIPKSVKNFIKAIQTQRSSTYYSVGYFSRF
jgi:hypothetical protein